MIQISFWKQKKRLHPIIPHHTYTKFTLRPWSSNEMLGQCDKAVHFEKSKCEIVTSLLRPCCVGGVTTELYVRVHYVRAVSEGFPKRPRYVHAD